MNLSRKPSTFRTRKTNVLTKAQKGVKTKSKKIRNEMFSTDTKGIGKYAKKSDKGLSRYQAYRLERKALNNEALKINAKPAMIRAVGQSLAMNTAAPAASVGTAVGINAGNKIGSLIDGGANKSGTSNEEELKEGQDLALPDNYVVR